MSRIDWHDEYLTWEAGPSDNKERIFLNQISGKSAMPPERAVKWAMEKKRALASLRSLCREVCDVYDGTWREGSPPPPGQWDLLMDKLREAVGEVSE